MTSSSYLRAALHVFLGVFAVILFLNGDPLMSLTVARMAVAIVSAIALAFELFLWRLPALQKLGFFPVPDLTGTWKGFLISNHKTDDGSALEPIETYMVIKQTFFWVSVTQYTKESSSRLVTGALATDTDGTKQLVGTYRNDPRFDVRDRSHIHYEAFTYAIQGRPVEAFAGHYWTDRMTGGEARFADRVQLHCDSYELAQKAFQPRAEPVLSAEAN